MTDEIIKIPSADGLRSIRIYSRTALILSACIVGDYSVETCVAVACSKMKTKIGYLVAKPTTGKFRSDCVLIDGSPVHDYEQALGLPTGTLAMLEFD